MEEVKKQVFSWVPNFGRIKVLFVLNFCKAVYQNSLFVINTE